MTDPAFLLKHYQAMYKRKRQGGTPTDEGDIPTKEAGVGTETKAGGDHPIHTVPTPPLHTVTTSRDITYTVDVDDDVADTVDADPYTYWSKGID